MYDASHISPEDFKVAMDRDGAVILRNVVPSELLADFNEDLLEEFESMSSNGGLFEGGGRFSGHLNCFPGARARFVYDEARAAGIVDLVRSYRPDIADRFRPTLNFNLPGSVAQHYHMDDAFLKEFVICNIAVVDTDLVNGAIDVLPGTNRDWYPYWKFAVQRKHKLSTRIPLNRGDAIIRSSVLWHRGMPNRSATPRPMMAITFGEVENTTADPFATNDGDIEFYPNWFRTSRLGKLRERTFVTAPITYSAYRFATSLHGDKGYASF